MDGLFRAAGHVADFFQRGVVYQIGPHANYREPVTQKLLAEAVTEFLVIKDHEREQDFLSEPYLTRVKRDLNRLQKHFPAATVAELTGTRLLGYFEARGAAHKTFKNRRGVVWSRLSSSSRCNGSG